MHPSTLVAPVATPSSQPPLMFQFASLITRQQCPDIKNYDKDSFHNGDLFGDIDDPEGECGSSSDLCTWFEGSVTIGTADPIVGETSDICEF